MAGSEGEAEVTGVRRRPAGIDGGFSIRVPGPEDRFPTASLLAFAAFVGGYLIFTRKLFDDGDTGWHLAAGRYIFEARWVPHMDPFSFTFAGQPWHAHEWLAELVMAGVFGLAGWGGLAVLFGIAGGITVFLIGRELMRWMAVRWALCATFVVCGLLHPLALARPHMLAWTLLAAWVMILVRAREKGRAPTLWALPLMLVWANFHASYILGLGIAGVLALEAMITQPREKPVIVRWGGFLAAALLAAFLTPHDIQGFIYPFQVSGMHVVTVIDEWRATSFEHDRLFIAAAILVWLLIALRWRRIHPLRIVLLAGMTAMAVAHARHQMPLAIVAALMIGPLVSKQELRRREAISPRALWGAAAAAALLLVVVRSALPFEVKDNSAFPLTAFGHVPAPLRCQPMLNGYSFGGPLILAGVRPYIDGRADMYGDDFTLDYIAMLRGDMARFRRADRRWKFAWTILPPNARLVARLDREPGWRRLYADQWAVVHVRSAPAPSDE